jgi:hypothetical protein
LKRKKTSFEEEEDKLCGGRRKALKWKKTSFEEEEEKLRRGRRQALFEST